MDDQWWSVSSTSSVRKLGWWDFEIAWKLSVHYSFSSSFDFFFSLASSSSSFLLVVSCSRYLDELFQCRPSLSLCTLCKSSVYTCSVCGCINGLVYRGESMLLADWSCCCCSQIQPGKFQLAHCNSNRNEHLLQFPLPLPSITLGSPYFTKKLWLHMYAGIRLPLLLKT